MQKNYNLKELKSAEAICEKNRAAKLLIGEHDFGGFCRAEGKARMKSTVRTIYDLTVTLRDDVCEVRISGNGFLYNMVRIVAGTLLYISEGRRTEEDIRTALETGERSFGGITLPPNGLYLNKVFY